MGKIPSKQQTILHQYSSTYDRKTYQTNVRSYATWEHGEILVSNDISRLTHGGIQNFDKHKQFRSLSPIEKPIEQTKILKSLSNNDLLSVPNTITVEELLYGKKHRSKSPSELSTLTTKIKKKVPRDLTFVSINPNDLQNPNEIGKGNFGTVYHAIYQGTQHVAIKTLHIENDKNNIEISSFEHDENMRELLHEAHIMTCLKHPNVLRFLGITFFGNNKQLSLVTDFMKNGSLLDYLRKKREFYLKSNSLTVNNRLNNFARQIFQAMLYLEEKKIIHRDLATRNCLIGENKILKVADFGLTTLTECGLYKGTYRSICAPRWTAPEAIFHSKYSSRSDVWSYGITLWEIYSLGERPFGNMTNYAVKFILKNSSENLSRHLPKPKQFISDATYTHIILPCLTYNVTMRPHFKDLRERIITILNDL